MPAPPLFLLFPPFLLSLPCLIIDTHQNPRLLIPVAKHVVPGSIAERKSPTTATKPAHRRSRQRSRRVCAYWRATENKDEKVEGVATTPLGSDGEVGSSSKPHLERRQSTGPHPLPGGDVINLPHTTPPPNSSLPSIYPTSSCEWPLTMVACLRWGRAQH